MPFRTFHLVSCSVHRDKKSGTNTTLDQRAGVQVCKHVSCQRLSEPQHDVPDILQL